MDEERDPHFQRGRDLVNSQEFKAAMVEFEKALDTNPRSAAAHYELGCLYDAKTTNYAAAIYHYESYLALQTNSPRASLVRERISGCKLELASSEFPLPVSENLQRQVESLTQENRLLKQKLDEALDRLRHATSPHVNAPVAAAPASLAQPNRPTISASPSAPVRTNTIQVAAAGGRPRVYVIQARDTISSVASRYGLKPSAVLAANPSVNPNRLHIGQDLNLP